jgi:hypothetical protein
MDVCILWVLLSGRGLCDGLITHPEESYRVCYVCHREASITRRPWPTRRCRVIRNNLEYRVKAKEMESKSRKTSTTLINVKIQHDYCHLATLTAADFSKSEASLSVQYELYIL